jgi:SAM-dependent methyltransferase
MTPEQIAFELDYWRRVKTGHRERYEKMLDMWRYDLADSVLEVGTGPYDGFLPLLSTSSKRVGYDPLWPDYEGEGIAPARRPGIERVAECPTTPSEFAAVLSMNAIDHGDSDETAVATMAQLLQPGGRLYLHVHLRREDQLNIGHDHCLRGELLLNRAKEAGLREVRWTVYERDPIEDCAYRTFVAVWEKPA